MMTDVKEGKLQHILQIYIFLIIVDFSKMAEGRGLLGLPEEMLIEIAKHLGKGQFLKKFLC